MELFTELNNSIKCFLHLYSDADEDCDTPSQPEYHQLVVPHQQDGPGDARRVAMNEPNEKTEENAYHTRLGRIGSKPGRLDISPGNRH